LPHLRSRQAEALSRRSHQRSSTPPIRSRVPCSGPPPERGQEAVEARPVGVLPRGALRPPYCS
jgi:hypothetical protein